MFANGETLVGRLSVEILEENAPPAALLEPLAACAQPVFLDSAALEATYGRYSILTCCPLEVLTVRDGTLTNCAGDVLGRGRRELWRVLHQAFECVVLETPATRIEAPYLPGWFGYLGYELGRYIERLPGRAVRDTPLPDLRLAFHDAVAIYDAVQHQWALVELSFASPPPGAGKAADVLRQMLASAKPADQLCPTTAEQVDPHSLPTTQGQSNFTPEAYQKAVARCVEYITAGDIFQVNLSQRFTVRSAPPPLAIYQALRRRNPAWYAAYLSFESQGHRCAVLSSSPELFLRLRGEKVITRPIKGTRGRCGDVQTDQAAVADLLNSPKDNAELAMIIDLLRNDLGRVCRYGSLRVTEPRRLETHPTVFHMVGTVQGHLHRGIGPAELLRATFPGGSITGAPKIRAMEIIDELEGLARGIYTGCVGTVGVDGRAEWNIAIRTILCLDDTAHIQVGGGIVADSDPEDEYLETLHKARAMLEAINMAAVSVG